MDKKKAAQEARREKYRQMRTEKTELRAALKRIAVDSAATPAERLEAVKLILEMDR